MPLVVSLQPHERFVLNGATMRNGAKRNNITLENEVRLLRADHLPDENVPFTPAVRCHGRAVALYFSGDCEDIICRKIACLLRDREQQLRATPRMSELFDEALAWLGTANAFKAVTVLKMLANTSVNELKTRKAKVA